MVNRDFVSRVLTFKTVTRRIHATPGDATGVAITKIGGAPWWPAGVERPRCPARHQMNFLAQIRLEDIPGFVNGDDALLSFHYCMECADAGAMSFGWSDETNRSYDVRVLTNVEKTTPDTLGMVSEDVLGAQSVVLRDVEEVPSDGDLPEEIVEAAPEDFFGYKPPDYDEFAPLPSEEIYPGLVHVPSSKIGGFPTWVQDPEWPLTAAGKRMSFAGQLDYLLGERAPWGSGGYAYLFCGHLETGEFDAELSILTT